jgi:Ca2+-binding RTX toxin-like protein
MRTTASLAVALVLAASAFGGGGPITLKGTAKGETLRGAALADRLYGGGGRDGLWGYEGRDLLDGGSGNDLIYSGPGDDRAVGRYGMDQIDGGLGSDRLVGGPGRDKIWGGPGSDRVSGGAGGDQIDGNAGDDVIDARDAVSARRLADCMPPCWRVQVPPEADDVWGGGGNDKVLASDGRPDFIRCQEGYDVVSVDRFDRISPFADCERVRR